MFFIAEIQKTAETSTALPLKTANTLQEAESKYHEILMYAAISNVQAHSAIIFDDEGLPIMSQCYKHGGDGQ